MIPTSDLPTLYKTKKVYVWVEDEETGTYLTEVWQDPEIGLLVDLIHSIGRAQRLAGQVPSEINDLRAALRAHVGLPP